jgi:hypothetical protein
MRQAVTAANPHGCGDDKVFLGRENNPFHPNPHVTADEKFLDFKMIKQEHKYNQFSE